MHSAIEMADLRGATTLDVGPSHAHVVGVNFAPDRSSVGVISAWCLPAIAAAATHVHASQTTAGQCR